MVKGNNLVKKYIKYGIILIVIIGVLIVVNYITIPDMPSQIKNYLINQGYKKGEYDDLLVKNIGDKEYTFSLGDYSYTLDRETTNDGITKMLNATYNYKNESIIYSYRVYYSDYVNVYFKGNYKEEKFECEKEFSTASLSMEEQQNICDLARVDVQLFDLEAKTLFTKYKYIDYIKSK